MIVLKRSRRWISMTFLLLPVLAAGPGCGGHPPTPADPKVAREALVKALEAWQSGQSADSIGGDGPAIEVSDHQWSRGVRLVKFRIEPEDDRPAGGDHVFRVALWLGDGRGKPAPENTEYFVATSPTIRIIRSGL